MVDRTTAKLSYDDISYTEEGKEILREKDNLVFASNTEDGDCSGQVCTFIWSCADRNEILHFETQINATGYERDTGTNHKKSFNLATVLANQFGKILGLDHCSIGISELVINKQISIAGSLGCDSRAIPELIELYLSGKLDLSTSITSHHPLEEVNDCLEDLHHRKGNPIRFIITPNGTV